MIGARPDRPRALRLLAQYADYWNEFSVNRMDELVPSLRAVDAACLKAGRDPSSLQRTIALLVDLPGSPSDPAKGGFSKYFASRTPATGTPEQLAELLRAYASAGVDHVQIFVSPLTMHAIDTLASVLETLDRG